MSALPRSGSDAITQATRALSSSLDKKTQFPKLTIANLLRKSQGHLCISIDISFMSPNITAKQPGSQMPSCAQLLLLSSQR